MKKLSFLSVALLTCAAPALAGNVAPMIPQASNVIPAPTAGSGWAGLYGGATGGFIADGTSTYVFDFGGGWFDEDVWELGGSGFGGFVGYNTDVGNFVLGGEVSYQITDYAFQNHIAGLDSNFTWMIDIKLRAGVPMGRALVYGFGGLSIGEWDNRTGLDIVNASGLNLGGGVDFMVSDRIFAGIEYIHRNLFAEFMPTSGIWHEFGTVQGRVGFRF